MRYLVISDTHGDISRASWLIECFQDMVDGVLHLGDLTGDFEKLKNKYQDKYSLAFLGVPGNCDLFSRDPSERSFTVEGVRIAMTHGDKYAVKYGTSYISRLAEKEKAKVVLFGHTHIPLMEEKGGVLYVNPGSLSEPRGGSRAGFALLEVEKGKAVAILNNYDDFA